MRLIDNIAHRLYLGVSTMPNAGIGVITGIDHPAGVPICEYKGDVFIDEGENESAGNDMANDENYVKKFSMGQLAKRYMYTIVGGYKVIKTEYVVGHAILGCRIDAHPALSESPIGFGGYVNDVRTWENRKKSEEVYDENDPKYDGVSRPVAPLEKQLKQGYNVSYWNVPGRPILYLLSLRDIKAGEELFVDYGYPYWQADKEREADRVKNLESQKASELVKAALEATRDEA